MNIYSLNLNTNSIDINNLGNLLLTSNSGTSRTETLFSGMLSGSTNYISMISTNSTSYAFLKYSNSDLNKFNDFLNQKIFSLTKRADTSKTIQKNFIEKAIDESNELYAKNEIQRNEMSITLAKKVIAYNELDDTLLQPQNQAEISKYTDKIADILDQYAPAANSTTKETKISEFTDGTLTAQTTVEPPAMATMPAETRSTATVSEETAPTEIVSEATTVSEETAPAEITSEATTTTVAEEPLTIQENAEVEEVTIAETPETIEDIKTPQDVKEEMLKQLAETYNLTEEQIETLKELDLTETTESGKPRYVIFKIDDNLKTQVLNSSMNILKGEAYISTGSSPRGWHYNDYQASVSMYSLVSKIFPDRDLYNELTTLIKQYMPKSYQMQTKLPVSMLVYYLNINPQIKNAYNNWYNELVASTPSYIIGYRDDADNLYTLGSEALDYSAYRNQGYANNGTDSYTWVTYTEKSVFSPTDDIYGEHEYEDIDMSEMADLCTCDENPSTCTVCNPCGEICLTVGTLSTKIENRNIETGTPGSPLILDTNGDGKVSATAGKGVDIDNDGKADGAATGGDKMLAMTDINGNNKVDGAEVFGNYTVSPFTKKALNAANGFEALKMIAKEAKEYTGVDCFDGTKVDVKKLAQALAEVGVKLGFVSGNNVTEVEDLSGVSAIEVENYTQITDKGTKVEHLQQGSYIDENGQTRKVDDVWFR